MSRTAAKAPPQSELVSVVAWMQIVGSGFWALVALLMFGFAIVLAWALHAVPQQSPASPWPLFGVGCFFLAGALLMLGTGLGLRHRHDWARRLTAGLCYIGVFGSIALFCLVYSALGHMLSTSTDNGNASMFPLVGLVLKVFFGGLMLATVSLLVWVANRFNRAALVAEFRAGPVSDERTQDDGEH
jgi:hypothetical protein